MVLLSIPLNKLPWPGMINPAMMPQQRMMGIPGQPGPQHQGPQGPQGGPAGPQPPHGYMG